MVEVAYTHYEMAENSIVLVLKRDLPKTPAGNPIALVEAYPDDPKDLEMPVSSVRFLCGWTSSSFDDVSLEPQIVQMEELKLTGYLEVIALRGRRGHQGAYRILNAINSILRGFYPLKGGPLKPIRPTGCSLKDQTDGAWLWQMNFSCWVYSGQDYSPALTDVDEFDLLTLPEKYTIEAGIWRTEITRNTPDETNSTLDNELIYSNQ